MIFYSDRNVTYINTRRCLNFESLCTVVRCSLELCSTAEVQGVALSMLLTKKHYVVLGDLTPLSRRTCGSTLPGCGGQTEHTSYLKVRLVVPSPLPSNSASLALMQSRTSTGGESPSTVTLLSNVTASRMISPRP